MSVARELLALAEATGRRLDLPAVSAILVPPRRDDPPMQGEFGVVMLVDGSAGFFYALLDDTLRRLHEELDRAGAAVLPPIALATRIESDDALERAVALGAVSAITQHVFRHAGFTPAAARSSFGGDAFGAEDHVGMVGLVPSLSRRLRDRGVPLTVLELREDRVQREPGFEVTLDPAKLRRCNRVLCTASTLINGTLDAVLAECAGADRVSLIGPSASCFPDPLFARRIDVVAGARVTDPGALRDRLEAGEDWGDTVERYAIETGDYPGFEGLLAAARDGAGAG